MALIKPPAVNLSLVTLLLSLLFVASYGAADQPLGGTTAIKDVKTNKEVQELGRYSVEEYNRRRKSGNGAISDVGELRFREVVEAAKQVVSGIKYYLKVSAVAQSGEQKTFNSVVVVKSNTKELLDFAPSSD